MLVKNEFRTEIIDGKEVIVKSTIQELDFQTVQGELNRVASQMEHMLYQVENIKKEYAQLKKEHEFYKETMSKFVKPETEELGDDIFHIE